MPKSEPNWACFRVEGPLDFALYGILARISGALAAQRISIFAVSTFDTDYIASEGSGPRTSPESLDGSGICLLRPSVKLG